MTLKNTFVKPCIARMLNPPPLINNTPGLGSNLVDSKNKFQESEINILLEAECERNKILQTILGDEINNLSTSKTLTPLP